MFGLCLATISGWNRAEGAPPPETAREGGLSHTRLSATVSGPGVLFVTGPRVCARVCEYLCALSSEQGGP